MLKEFHVPNVTFYYCGDEQMEPERVPGEGDWVRAADYMALKRCLSEAEQRGDRWSLLAQEQEECAEDSRARLWPEYPPDEFFDAFRSVNCHFDAEVERLTFSGDFGSWVACYQAMRRAALATNPAPAHCPDEVANASGDRPSGVQAGGGTPTVLLQFHVGDAIAAADSLRACTDPQKRNAADLIVRLLDQLAEARNAATDLFADRQRLGQELEIAKNERDGMARQRADWKAAYEGKVEKMLPISTGAPGRVKRTTCNCGSGSAACSGDFECCYLDPPDTLRQGSGEADRG